MGGYPDLYNHLFANAVKTQKNNYGLGILKAGLALLMAASLVCGCSTVKPELTAQDRAFNEQRKEDSRSHSLGAAEGAVGRYCLSCFQAILYGMGSAGVSFQP